MPRCYYVDASAGSDANSGLAPDAAWRTLGRATAQAWSPGLRPGDCLCLRGTFCAVASPLYISLDRSWGSPDAPLRITGAANAWPAWPGPGPGPGPGPPPLAGGGDAVIRTVGSHAVLLDCPAATKTGALGVSVERLVLRGDGRACPTSPPTDTCGLLVWNGGAADLAYLRVTDVDASGFTHAGVLTGRRLPDAGRIKDVVLSRVRAHDNPGAAGRASWTGSGIVLSGVQGASMEGCSADRNGALSANAVGGGPVGAWAWDATDVAIRGCTASGNLSGNGRDGGGFDLDGGVVRGVIEDCASCNNFGAGYLLSSFPGSAPSSDLAVRRCVSVRDNVGGTAGAAIYVWGGDTAANGLSNVSLTGNRVWGGTLGAACIAAPYGACIAVAPGRVVTGLCATSNAYV
jgi:hypothetical protein